MKIFIEPTFTLFENLEVGDMFEVNDKLYTKTGEIVKFADLENKHDIDAKELLNFMYEERTYNCIELSSQKFYNVAGNMKVRKIVEVHCK